MIPLNRYTIGAMVAVVLVIAAFVAVKRWEGSIRCDVRQEIAAETMKADLEQANEDAALMEAKVARGELRIAELMDQNAALSSRVRDVHTVIRERVASGELANGSIPAVKLETMNQIEAMEAEALEAEQ